MKCKIDFCENECQLFSNYCKDHQMALGGTRAGVSDGSFEFRSVSFKRRSNRRVLLLVGSLNQKIVGEVRVEGGNVERYSVSFKRRPNRKTSLSVKSLKRGGL